MKRLMLLAALAILPGTYVMAATTSASAPVTRGMIKVAVVVSPGANLMDIAGPWEVFQDTSLKDADGKDVAPYELYTVAPSKAPIHTAGSNHPGMSITPDYDFTDAPAPDIVVVGAQSGGPGLSAWLQRMHAQQRVVMSVCTGAFKLAQAGLLDGKRATTHHWFFGNFQREFPQVKLVEQMRYVQADPITFTAGGLTSGVDLALHMVTTRFGRQVAQQTADYMEYMGTGWKTNHGISMLTTPVMREVWSGQIAPGNEVLLHVVTTGSSPAMTVDIPARHVVGAVATANPSKNMALSMTVHIAGHPAVFSGRMNASGNAVSGNLVQDGKSHPLTLSKQAANKPADVRPVDVHGVGVIKAIDLGTGTLTLRHQPIASLGWPAMTMMLKVASSDLLKAVTVGEKVQFTLHQPETANIITAIKPAQP